MTALPSRIDVEDFLYREASLLDSWKLDEWLTLFTPDATYGVPAPDAPNGSFDETLFVIADDYARLSDRVTQLMGNEAWAERPRSRTRRLVTNVTIEHVDGGVEVWSNLALYRTRFDKITVFFGRTNHLLKPTERGFAIRRRRVILDLESLQSVGKISFIL